MKAIVFDLQQSALDFAAQIDSQLGFPKHGSDIGSGKHVPPEESLTLTYSVPFKHPSKNKWAYPTDQTISPLIPSELNEINLDDSWFE